ncbi:MAG: hypothetical protein WA081_03725 [Desulfosalsimonadaceae bacterium]
MLTDAGFSVFPMGNEFLVNTADKFERDCVKGILGPEKILAVFHFQVAADKIRKHIQMRIFYMPLFIRIAPRKKITVETFVEPAKQRK